MKIRYVTTFLAISGVATLAYAQNPLAGAKETIRNATGKNKNEAEGREAALKALEQHYGNAAKVRITGEHEINGVRVYAAEVSNGSGTATALATGTGHIIETGLPGRTGNMPEAVRDVTQGLFHASPADVEIVDDHYFFVQATTGGHDYVVMMDATGRVTAIDSPQRLREVATESDRAAPAAEKQEIGKMMQQRFPEAQVHDIRTAHEYPGYYVAYLTGAGGSGMAIVDNKDDVISYRMPRAQNTFPEPVQHSIAMVLKGDQIKNAGIGLERAYRVIENAGAEEFVLVVRSNGEIERVGERREAAATTAGHRVK